MHKQMTSYPKHLTRQLGFLERSCASFDAGFSDEALRIAVTLRILLHDTRSSTSLLHRFEKPELHLLSTTDYLPSSQYWSHSGYLSVTTLTIEASAPMHSVHRPNLNSNPERHHLLPWQHWWNESVVVVDRALISRKQICLGAANKEGGAHVDPSLSAEYEALVSSGIGIITDDPNGSENVNFITGKYLADIRQMGHEILNSPELLTLTNDEASPHFVKR